MRFPVVSSGNEGVLLAMHPLRWLRPRVPKLSTRHLALPGPSANIRLNNLRDNHPLPKGSTREDEVAFPKMGCLLS
ncbi:MAG: hypothetical protein QOF74_1153 [Caballeronia mineralivorans]|nr:hypothetical protein [Caballeronia mineralivorans]